ncbi:hypothetical protein AYK24_07310 [Thermoplasmatales archaeon SG8-52-4]|nr:MAG: hypothetical protein AYK24_07310 [Thermoplasmatales archaeon SG8-52-4]
MNDEKVTIQKGQVTAISPEGVTACMKDDDFYKMLLEPKMDTCGLILPDGVKCVISRGQMTIFVFQIPPRLYNLKWIANDSKAPYGKDAKYRDVRIALPYVNLLAVYSQTRHRQMRLTHNNECFFRNKPLSSLNDELMYPALLNCSKFSSEEGKPLSWLCTQYLKVDSLSRIEDTNKYIRTSLSRLISCLWETGFNLSSEKHEGNSWYSESVRRGVDPRISTIEKWQEATKKDQLFVLDVPWIGTGRTVGQIINRIFQNHGIREKMAFSISDLSRIVFNNNKYETLMPIFFS